MLSSQRQADRHQLYPNDSSAAVHEHLCKCRGSSRPCTAQRAPKTAAEKTMTVAIQCMHAHHEQAYAILCLCLSARHGTHPCSHAAPGHTAAALCGPLRGPKSCGWPPYVARVQSSNISTGCGKASCAFPLRASSVAKKRSSTCMQPRRQLTAGAAICIALSSPLCC